MTLQPRSVSEYGDPIEREEHTDHVRAGARGLRLGELTDAIVGTLNARGILPSGTNAKVIVFSVLADHLYGDKAIDVPCLTDTKGTVNGSDVP